MKIEVSLSGLMSIASALVHHEEARSPGGAPLDVQAADSWKSNPEAMAIMSRLEQQGFLPVRRDGVKYVHEEESKT